MDSKYNITSKHTSQQTFRNSFSTQSGSQSTTSAHNNHNSNNGNNHNNGNSFSFKRKSFGDTETNGFKKLKQERPHQTKSIQEQKRALPIFSVKEQLLHEIECRHTVIVLGETGSGKTTQIPQFLHEMGLSDEGIIGITQPRRVAAISVSRRVSAEMGTEIGTKVGYKVRFDDCTTDETKIKFLTDGSLLREALSDKLLRQYRVIILDEAHERTINTDILFGIVKEAQRARRQSYSQIPPLKIIIMSATMDVDHFSEYFNNCPVLYLEGRTHNIRFMHIKKSQSDYVSTCLQTILDLHTKAPENHDFLVFLTGQDEIDAMVNTIKQISSTLEGPRIRPFPLYAALPYRKQMEVFAPAVPNTRKIILSTNIAETSLTIPGIKYVIDSGMVKMRTHDPITGIDTLKVSQISKAQALQRAGRAGRESDGFCYRAYTLNEYESMAKATIPEIRRCNLASVALQLLNMDIEYDKFDFIDVPPIEGVKSAVKQLLNLGAINDLLKPKLTDLGKKMCRFPLDPQYSKILLASSSFNCVEEMLNIISVLASENIFLYPNDKKELARERHAMFEDKQGDHITLLRIFRAYLQTEKTNSWCRENFFNYKSLDYAKKVKQQLSEICHRLGMPASSCGSDTDAVRKCLITGLFTNIAELQSDNHYLTLSNNRQRVKIHPSSVLCDKEKPKLILFSELITTGRTYVRTVTSIEPEWVTDYMPKLARNAATNGFKTMNGGPSNSTSSNLFRF
uniref:RNA helicase n=2 Tax=Culicoides sonorensis TaxID=179676 RepID=A0A336MTZ8_CULSO